MPADLVTRIRSLSPSSREALAVRLEREGAAFNAAPLSFAQEALWLAQQVGDERSIYNVSLALRVNGRLDLPALESALSTVVARHSALRTTIHEIAGSHFQIVADPERQPIHVVDLQGYPASARAAAEPQIQAVCAGKAFDLSAEPPVAAVVLRLAPERHLLMLILHHIACDEWSLNVLFGELSEAYAASHRGEVCVLPSVGIQYVDFARWERTRGDVIRRDVEYWTRNLAGMPTLQLPTVRIRPAAPSRAGASHPVHVASELWRRVQAFAKAREATPFQVLLASFEALLSRYAGQDDFGVAITTAGRERPEVQQSVGLFANTLIIRSDVPGDPTFSDLLERVRARLLAAYEHQHAPLQMVVQELQPERGLTPAPLAQVAFGLSAMPVTAAAPLPDVVSEVVFSPKDAVRFEIAVALSEQQDGLVGEFLFNTDLFDHSAIVRMSDCWRHVLLGALDEPDTRISLLPVVDPETHHRLDASTSESEAPRTAPELFDAAVRQTPAAIALICGERTTTYAELHALATKVAWTLRRRGIGADDRVGLYAGRDVQAIAAMLGIWKTGAVYVPLDPGYPVERLVLMAKDANLALVLSDAELPAALARVVPGTIELLDMTVRDVPSDDIDALPVPADRAAYIIYTSGSTGQPKGVVVEHGALASTLRGAQDAFGFASPDVVPCMMSFSFDISLFEILSPLAAGASVFLLQERPTLAVSEWDALIQRVTFLHGPPTLLRQVVDAAATLGTRYGNVRHVMVGGDAVPPALVTSILQTFPSAAVDVGYGPTEAAIMCTLHRIDRATPPSGHPIGRPMRNVRVRVCDNRQRLLPPGVPGELLIGGPGLARGYLGDTDLTARRFPMMDGLRFHRSGDLVRQHASGDLEFLGRMDAQVKIRGYRVHVGEIEAAFGRDPAIKDVVVAARAAASGEQRLVAYYTAAPGHDPEPTALRAALRAHLPEYAVPVAIVRLQELPHSATTGKVDREALPAPEALEEPRSAAHDAAPQNDSERVLADIACALFSRQTVHRTDDFFDLGGDSILSIQLVARAHERGLRLTPRQVFQHRTIAALAEVAERRWDTGAAEATEGGELPLSAAQSWFFEQTMAEPAYWNQAVMLEAMAPVAVEALRQAVDVVMRRHEGLRQRFAPTEAGWRTWVAPVTTVPVTVVDLRGVEEAAAEAVRTRVCGHVQQSLDLTSGPLWRVVVLRLTAEEQVLVMAHHLVLDATAWGLMLEELETAYQQVLDGTAVSSALAPSQRHWVRGEVATAQRWPAPTVEAWVTRARAAAADAERWGPVGQEAGVRRVTETVSAAATRTLLEETAGGTRARMDEVLLTVLGVAAARTGANGIGVFLEEHGRSDDATGAAARTIGWLSRRYPVAVLASATPNWDAALAGVKEQVRSGPPPASYGQLRYLGQAASRTALAAAGEPAVVLTYLGQERESRASRLFRRSTASPGPTRSQQAPLSAAIELTAVVRDQRLHLAWTYAQECRDAQALVGAFEAALQEFVDHCRRGVNLAPTTSDIAAFGWTERDLERIASALEGAEESV